MLENFEFASVWCDCGDGALVVMSVLFRKMTYSSNRRTLRMTVPRALNNRRLPPRPNRCALFSVSSCKDIVFICATACVPSDAWLASVLDWTKVSGSVVQDAKKPSTELNGHFLVDHRRNDVDGQRPHELKVSWFLFAQWSVRFALLHCLLYSHTSPPSVALNAFGRCRRF